MVIKVTLVLSEVYSLIISLPQIVVSFDKVVKPDTFKDDDSVELWFNIVKPEIFNGDTIVTLLFSVVNPDILNADNKVVLFANVVNPDTYNDDTKVFDNVDITW